MFQPRLISPMLDGFLMGDPISDHSGVRCCPAMKQGSDEKYIVKIISLPSSPSRVDALLLTGACKSKEEAKEYFRVKAEGIADEFQILQKLSKLDGFLSYESCQIVENEDFGYDVYLLGTYKYSLEKYLTRNNVTYKDALKLAIDLCSALASCRRAGYLYVDLKPENIYVSDDNEYQIADLGFLKLDSLKFATLSDIYRSAYTAPEIDDAFAALNPTMDVYATGIILYRIFNDCRLPVRNGNTFPAPLNADGELAEIILKAIAPEPEDRWQDPVEIGQALVAYMQEQNVSDTTILSQHSAPEDAEEIRGLYETTNRSDTDKIKIANLEEFSLHDDIPIESIYTEDEYGNLSFIDHTQIDYKDAAVDANTTDYHNITADTSGIMLQADDLISHHAPSPVIPPEKVEIPMPDPIVIEPPEVTTEMDDTQNDAEIAIDSQPENTVRQEEVDENEHLTPINIGKLLRNIAIACIALILVFCGYFYYRYVYIQDVSIRLDVSADYLSVFVDSNIKSEKLYVICTDANGNRFQKDVTNGKAVFTELLPNASYTVKVETKGFHKLVGNVSETYATPVQVNVVQFYAVPGITEGSVKLNFLTDPADTSHITNWKISYDTPGEATKVIALNGKSVTISGLTVGAAYAFRLEPASRINYSGVTEATFTPQMLVRAQNLKNVYFQSGKLTVSWDVPEGAETTKWIVRCYDNQNYDTTVEVYENTATFHGVSTATTYSVEVTADGMPQSERINVTKDKINISNLTVTDTIPEILTLTWESDKPVSAGGWVLEYTINGSETRTVSGFPENTVNIMGYIPGATYSFALKTADESIIHGGTIEFTTQEIKELDLFGYKKSSLSFVLRNQATQTTATKFHPGDKAYFSVSRNIYAGTPSGNDSVTIVTAIKDADGTVVCIDIKDTNWRQIWQTTYYKLSLPDLPETAGDYVVNVYFNNQLAHSKNITIQ